MILANGDSVVFRTKESDGEDICISDGIGRFTLVHEDEIDALCEMLQKMKRREAYWISEVNPRDYVNPDDQYL